MKNLFKLIMLFFTLSISVTNAQVGIGNSNPKAVLDISSSDITAPLPTDGLLVPRVNVFPSTNPGTDQQSMIFYLTTNLTGVNISGTAQNYSKGFYYWDNTISNWAVLGTDDTKLWSLDGNSGTDGGALNFLGTTDNQPIAIRTNNIERFKFTSNNQLEFINTHGNTVLGENAGGAYVYPTTSGTLKRNIFIGYNAGANYNGSSGASSDNYYNTAVGASAMGLTSQSGGHNTAIGYSSLENITGTYNVAVGNFAYNAATDASNGTALGNSSLYKNTTGPSNTATGYWSMYHNSTGGFNVANGTEALKGNLTGHRNVGVGAGVLESNNDSDDNLALGSYALNVYNGIIGQNTAIGADAMRSYNTGNNNVALGYTAGFLVSSGDNNLFLGVKSGARGLTNPVTAISGSLFIGNEAGTDATANNLMYIENSATSTPLIGGDFANDKVGINIDMSTPANLTHTLTVGGDVKAVDFEATASGTVYADYVFEDYFGREATINTDYKFMPLNEAIAFVKEKGHLPNVKSYKEVEANNFEISLTETSLKNLEKIEENFLYISELKTENDKLKAENESLKESLSKIEAQQKEILELLKNK